MSKLQQGLPSLALGKRGISLPSTLIVSVTLVIILAAGSIGLLSYFNSKSAYQSLWYDLASQIATTTTERTLRFLVAAPPLAQFSADLLENKVIAANDPNELLEYCAATLETLPDFFTFSLSKADGSFIGAYRTSLHGIATTIRNQIDEHKTQIRTFHQGESGKWQLVSDTVGNYDPRTRPFWKVGLRYEQGGWSDPYLIWNNPQVAVFAYVLPIYKAGELMAMWTVEFDLDRLSLFLSSLKIGDNGMVQIVTEEGVVIANSQNLPGIIINNGKTEFLTIEKSHNATLLNALQKLQENPDQPQNLEIGHFLIYLQLFPKTYRIPWAVLTVVPSEQFFAPILRQALLTLLVAVTLCILLIILAALFFGHLSRKLKEIADEMDHLANFQFSEELLHQKPSRIREINMMNVATDRLKIGLQSFSKYVPVQLVKDLIQSGQMAMLGGEKKRSASFFPTLLISQLFQNRWLQMTWSIYLASI